MTADKEDANVLDPCCREGLAVTTKLPIVSMFCGAGGLDLGFRNAHFRTIVAYDSDSAATQSFNFNAKRSVALVADLSLLTAGELFEVIDRRSQDSAPVGMIGGPPCHGFSIGNVHADPTDPRNCLPFSYAELLAAANDRYNLHFFLFENVIGLTLPKHAERFSRIKAAFGAAGFHVFQGELDSRCFGVPQARRRLFIVGLNSKVYTKADLFEFPVGSTDIRNPSNVGDAIRGLAEPTLFRRGLRASGSQVHHNHWTMMPKSARFVGGAAAGPGRSFKRLEWDRPSPTIAYGNREIHIHPDGHRRLSVYEAMLLQGFPGGYQLMGNLSEQITQVSNAVPPPLAEAIAVELRRIILRKTLTVGHTLASTGVKP